MKICVIGPGGREHALADVLGRTAEVVVTPGNAGIPGSVPDPPTEIDADLYVIGPEAPLVAGLADELRAKGGLVFGPGADGACLEGSKAWMKRVLADAGVPTARHASFTEAEPALAYLHDMTGFYVIKTDGLAAGKGVLVTESLAEARDAVQSYLSGEAFGEAGRRVVIEEGLTGPEMSLLVVTDGTRVVPLEPAQDFKRIGTGDVGPNTGGMGAYSPVPWLPESLVDQVMTGSVEPTLHELRRRGIDYRGVLYAGLMLTPDGPKMLEYNVRFGDPESQVVLPRFASDLAELLHDAASGRLGAPPRFDAGAAVTVVGAAAGYPAAPQSGAPIDGIARAEALPGVKVYCAGVGRRDDGALIATGGRVLNVTGIGPSVADARARAYAGIEQIRLAGMQFRTDIAAGID